jgi:parvulin-like peptidyl-prolyl isomerase
VEAIPSSNPILPSPTPQPLAARVNGSEISLAEYEAELALYGAASGTDPTPEEQQRVLEDLIDQTLLAQAANEQGFIVTEGLLGERIEQMGGAQALTEWTDAHGYTEETFRLALARAIAAAWTRDQIVAAVPTTADQVHAIQILLYNVDEANEVYAQLQAGNDFNNLAIRYDPVTGGDLSWFPRGYLPDSNLEEVAFDLEPNTHSPVIETLAGFHILLVVERDPERELSPQALLVVQAQALEDWLEIRRGESNIEILLP